MFTANEFFTRYGVQAAAVPVASYVRWVGGDGQTPAKRVVWGLALARDEVDTVTQRVLRFTMETGMSPTADEEFDWDDDMPGLVSDAGYGALPFDEFVAEGYGDSCDAVQQYALWHDHVTWRGQVEAWLRGNTELREDFYRIGTD